MTAIPPATLIILFLALTIAGCAEEETTTEETERVSTIENRESEPPNDVEVQEEQPVSTADRSGEVASGRLFQDRANRVVGGTIPIVLIESIDLEGSSMVVTLREAVDMPAYEDYFEIADEANRIVAITSMRWFRDLPALQKLQIEIPRPGGPRIYELDRTEVADYYNLSFSEMAKDPSEETWRTSFLVHWDTPPKRERFAAAHLK